MSASSRRTSKLTAWTDGIYQTAARRTRQSVLSFERLLYPRLGSRHLRRRRLLLRHPRLHNSSVGVDGGMRVDFGGLQRRRLRLLGQRRSAPPDCSSTPSARTARQRKSSGYYAEAEYTFGSQFPIPLLTDRFTIGGSYGQSFLTRQQLRLDAGLFALPAEVELLGDRLHPLQADRLGGLPGRVHQLAVDQPVRRLGQVERGRRRHDLLLLSLNFHANNRTPPSGAAFFVWRRRRVECLASSPHPEEARKAVSKDEGGRIKTNEPSFETSALRPPRDEGSGNTKKAGPPCDGPALSMCRLTQKKPSGLLL